MTTDGDSWLDFPPERPSPRPAATARARVVVVEGERRTIRQDTVTTEEPLEIRLLSGGHQITSVVTMRTPGADFELAAGLLSGEGLVADAGQIQNMTYCVDRSVSDAQRYNIVNVTLKPGVTPPETGRDRTLAMSSACGVCGAANLEALHLRGCRPVAAGPRLTPAVITALPDALKRRQRLFAATGGIHAAGLFTAGGAALVVREDVGRHNAVDKVLGWALLQQLSPADAVLMVSSRASYEILQKALVAGVTVVCCVSAPSSLAVSLAEEFGITLIGFMRGRRFNVYSGVERVAAE